MVGRSSLLTINQLHLIVSFSSRCTLTGTQLNKGLPKSE